MEKRKIVRRRVRKHKRARRSIASFLVLAMLSTALISAVAFALPTEDSVEAGGDYIENVVEGTYDEGASEETTEGNDYGDAGSGENAAAGSDDESAAGTVAAAGIGIAPLTTVAAGTHTGADIQAIIAGASAGDTITFDPGVTINGGFTISQGIILQGNNTIVNLGGPSSANASMITIASASNVTISGFTINGTSDPAAAAGAANIMIFGPSSNVNITNNTLNVSSVAGGDNAAVSTQFLATPTAISGLVISGNTINGAGANRALIINAGANGTVISGNTFAGEFAASLLINVNDAQIIGNTFAESYSVPNGNNIVIWDFGNDPSGSFNTVITGNTFKDGQAVNIVFDDPARDTNVDARYLLENNTYLGLDDGDRVLSPADSSTEGDVYVMVITFNSMGGSSIDPFVGLTGDAIGTLPVPTRANYTFAGWFTAATGGTQVTATTTFDEGTELFAQWTAVTEPDPDPDPGKEDPDADDRESALPKTGDSTNLVLFIGLFVLALAAAAFALRKTKKDEGAETKA